MKQILKSFAVLALAVVSASCAKEQISAPSGEEAVVSFTVSAPVLQTKAIADGHTVDKVACCVYNSDGDLIKDESITKVVPMTNGDATFSVRLVTGQTYSFLFWAYKSNDSGKSDYYTLDEGNKKVTVSYTGASNDESRDAFYRYIASKTITGAVNEKVELYRPFAQLNFGVEKADIAAAKAAGIEVNKSTVTLTNLATELDLSTGEVDEEKTTTAAFTLADCPTENLTVNSTAYGYVAMNYVLVGKGKKTTADATLTIAKDAVTINTLEVNAIPLQGNYRTNVIGNLFTSAVVNKIIVNPAFETPDIVQEFVSITAESIENANALIEQNSDSDIIEVKFAAKPEDVASKAILTTKVKESGTLNVEVAADTGENTTLYVGDYQSETVGDSMPTDDNAKAATVNIIIPENTKIAKIVVNAPTKTVKFNGVAIADGEYTIEELEAITSKTTLVIEKGQAVKKLVFHKGGLEIHGTVNEVKIEILDEDKGKDAKEVIEVRECENLNSTVFAALEKYIKTGYVSRKNADGTYDIYAPVKIGTVGYATLKDAVAAVGSEETTITLIDDIKISSQVTIKDKKIILNTNGCTVDPTGCRALVVDGTGEMTVNGGGKFIATNKTGDNNAILSVYSGKLIVGNVYLEGANVCIAVDGGAAVINDAEIKALDGGGCVLCQGGEIDVNGSKFYCDAEDRKGPGACWACDGGIIRIWNGNFEAVALVDKDREAENYWNYCLFDYASAVSYGYVAGTITVYGGTFKAFNPADNDTQSNYVAEGYQSVEEKTGYWTVSKIFE